MKRIYSFGAAFLMFLSGVWHHRVNRTKCDEASQRQEQPHIELEDMQLLTHIETQDLKLAPPVPFAHDDGELAVYEMLFLRPVRTPWLTEAVVAPIMVPDQTPEFLKS
jgi:hypothetical protein